MGADSAFSSLRSNAAPPRREWAVATDRLGLVGELNTQIEEIARLEQLEEHFQRDSNRKNFR